MRKWLTRCAVAAALIGVVLLVVSQYHPPGIWMGKPLPLGRVKPQLVSAGDTALLLAPDGSLWAWGGTQRSLTNVLPQPAISQVPLRVGSDTDWIQVAGSMEHTVALKNDGSLWAWGRNDEGEVGQGNFTHSYNTPTRIGTETNWTKISAGMGYSLALKNDGSLWTWGANYMGQLGDGTRIHRCAPTLIGADRDWRTIAAGSMTSFALKSNGVFLGWGYASVFSNKGFRLAPGQLDQGTNWAAISAYGFTLLALKNDGTLWLKSLNAQLPTEPAAGARAPMQDVLSSLCSGSTATFTQVGQENAWIEVYAGEDYFFARKKVGSWWVCGQSRWGQLGLGTNVGRVAVPQRIPFHFDPWAFAPGVQATLLLGKDGKLWTWGRRLGAERPTALGQRLQSFLAPAVRRFPSLRFLIKSDIDYTPHLLWELPPEVRRSLGTGPNSATNHLTSGPPGDTTHM
jgi:alpha-tubulin suppressor-like RCC1 family protein